MYILYGNIAGRTELDRGSNEFEMLETIENFLRKDENMSFLLVHYDEITTEPGWKTIRGREGYIKYMKDYNNRILQNKTCVELKREILDLSDKNKVKALKN